MSTGFIIYGILFFICIAMSPRMDDVYAKTIMWVQTLLIGLFVLEVKGAEVWVQGLYILTMPAIMVYAYVKKHIAPQDKVLIISSAVFVLLGALFWMLDLPGAGILQMLALLSIISLLLLMFKGSNELYNEIGFMFVLAVVSGFMCINYLVNN